MASNRLPMKPAELLNLGSQMLAGLQALGGTLRILDVTPETFSEWLAAFEKRDAEHLNARGAEREASRAAQAADAEIASWLYKARGVLTGWLATRWTTLWAAGGFVNGSTAVPETVGERLGLVAQLANYFAVNPEQEVPALAVTGAGATALFETAREARSSANAARADKIAKQAARSTADAALRRVMRGLIGILGMKLNDDDPRWREFGLNAPGALTTPAQPEQVSAEVLPAGAIIARCEPVPLAQRYRWRVKVAGVDAEFRLAASTEQPLAKIDRLPASARVELCVQAVNASAQSVPSAAVHVTMTAAAGFPFESGDADESLADARRLRLASALSLGRRPCPPDGHVAIRR